MPSQNYASLQSNDIVYCFSIHTFFESDSFTILSILLILSISPVPFYIKFRKKDSHVCHIESFGPTIQLRIKHIFHQCDFIEEKSPFDVC